MSRKSLIEDYSEKLPLSHPKLGASPGIPGQVSKLRSIHTRNTLSTKRNHHWGSQRRHAKEPNTNAHECICRMSLPTCEVLGQ